MKHTLSLLLFFCVATGHAAEFQFVETKGEHIDIKYGDRNVVRFVNKPRDGTTKDTHYMSFKPFHQVFDPKTGETNLSSGAHPLTKEFQFPHHRGLFFGFNKITYGDKQTADIWHGTNNVFSTVDKMLSMKADAKMATHTAAISWHGSDGKTFAEEERTVKVFNMPKGAAGGNSPEGTSIDWSTVLTTKLLKVRLDGDPQHAGFHFRASQEVAKSTAKQTYYLRQDGTGKGKEGETRNWDAKGKDPRTINLRWNAMSFVIANKRYTVLRISHPKNPKETRGSERDYGRFGDYFEYDLTPETPLKLKYNVIVVEGELNDTQCEYFADTWRATD